jgi:hypothetical protein
MSDNTVNTCDFCASINREEATTCVSCGHQLREMPTKQFLESKSKRTRLVFILSRIGAADFMGLTRR